jgi:hypothetical protein
MVRTGMFRNAMIHGQYPLRCPKLKGEPRDETNTRARKGYNPIRGAASFSWDMAMRAS